MRRLFGWALHLYFRLSRGLTLGVRAAVLNALTRIAASGQAAGVLSTEDAFIADCVKAGARFVGVGGFGGHLGAGVVGEGWGVKCAGGGRQAGDPLQRPVRASGRRSG